jgi:hypothetical protein
MGAVPYRVTGPFAARRGGAGDVQIVRPLAGRFATTRALRYKVAL